VLLIEVEQGIEVYPVQRRRGNTNAFWIAEWNIKVPIQTEKHRWGLRSAYYSRGEPWGGGGAWSSSPWVIDECSGFCSDTMHHQGMARFTSIFILK
jgi:hypothetical protein